MTAGAYVELGECDNDDYLDLWWVFHGLIFLIDDNDDEFCLRVESTAKTDSTIDTQEESRNFYFLEDCSTTIDDEATLYFHIQDGDFGSSYGNEYGDFELSELSDLCWMTIFDFGFFCDFLYGDEY